jgi:serine/threonine protein kinase
MKEQRWQAIKDLFFEALERAPAQRDEFVAQACEGDEALRAEVLSLLAAHEDSATGDFITDPAALLGLTDPGRAPHPSWIGRRLGGYRVVEELGHGGMSEVYRAVRDDDEFQKEVAVKVLRSGYDIDVLLQRFSIERQILATLDHPHIARLLDAGSTEEKLPYILMEYVRGRPIDEYCRDRRLGVRERLALFRKLCDAVQYVHQHLMVHGDLKCSNILVTDDGTPKLLDFGIAQLLGPKPGISAAAKTSKLVALTPDYASPEQVRGQPITTSSDVYSLGVLLYRLLSGISPYRLLTGSGGGFTSELARQICEHEPFRPSVSARLSGDSQFERQWHALVGDLDSIVMLALRKDPAKRYASVDQLRADIDRYLDGHPVTARGSSVGYHFAKFVGRHRASSAVAALFVLALLGGIVSTTQQKQIAEKERARAERHFESVRKLADTFMFDVHGAIETLPGSTPARQMLVANSLTYLHALAAESGGERGLQRDLASAYEKVADVQGGFHSANLGDPAGAMDSYRKALEIRTALAKSDPSDLDVQRDLIRNHGKLGEMLTGAGDEPGALEHTRNALAIAEKLAAGPHATAADRRSVASGLLSVGWQVARTTDLEGGLAQMKRAAQLYSQLLEKAPDDAAVLRLLSLTDSRIGEVLLASTTRFAEARDHYERSLDLVTRMIAVDPQNTRLLKIDGYARMGIAEAMLRQGSPRPALEYQMQAARNFAAQLEADPKNETARFDAAYALGEAVDSLIAMGDYATAEQTSRKAIEILERSSVAADAALTAVRVQRGVEYARSALASLWQAGLGAQRERSRHCERARQAFAVSEPILAAANADSRWKDRFVKRADEVRTRMADCKPLLASSASAR